MQTDELTHSVFGFEGLKEQNSGNNNIGRKQSLSSRLGLIIQSTQSQANVGASGTPP